MRFIICLFVIIVVLGQNSCKNGVTIVPNNALWSESIYLRGYQPTTFDPLTDKDIEEYAKNLKANHIRYAYLFAGPYDKDGHLPKYAFSDTAQRSVQLLKKYYNEIQILPWIGGLQNSTVFLGDSLWIKNALNDTEKLIKILSVPGVHVDLEYILPGEPYLADVIDKEKPGDMDSYAINVIAFHRKLRERLPKAFISSVVGADLPDTRPWKRKTSIEELRKLVKYIDQISFLYYDIQLNDQKLFEKNCTNLMQYIRILKAERDIQYLVAIGTFTNAPELQKYRNMKIENVPNSLRVIRQSARNVDRQQQLVDGISIYCEWATDQTEWQAFRENWTDIKR